MKVLKYILFSILLLTSVFSATSIYFVLNDAFSHDVDCSKQGVVNFLGFFSEFKTLYAASVAIFSVYYWTVQMDSVLQSNRRIEESKVNLRKSNALKESRYFHTEMQRRVREFYQKAEIIETKLFDYEWDMTEFSYTSAGRQNDEWNKLYDRHADAIAPDVFFIIFEFESIAANVLHGEVDDSMAIKLFGKPYCKQVKILYPFISRSREGKGEMDYLSNLVALYDKWSPMILVDSSSVD